MNNIEDFLRDVNRAFAKGDVSFLLEHCADDFCWIIVGERTISGKIAFAEALKQMAEMPPMEIQVQNVRSHGTWGVVEGIVVGRNPKGQKKDFGFCDVYELNKGPQMRKIISYVIDVSRHKRYRESC